MPWYRLESISIYSFVSFFLCSFRNTKKLGEKNGTKFQSNDGVLHWVGFRFHLSGKLNVSGKFYTIFFGSFFLMDFSLVLLMCVFFPSSFFL